MELEGGHKNSVIKRCNPIKFGLVSFVLTSTLILYGNQGLMMALEGGHRNSGLMMELGGGHRNSIIKQRNPIEFRPFSFVLTSTLILYGNHGLMMELEGGHRNSVIKRRNPISLGSFDSS
ncbi:hypothetical protein EVAR_47638_1 [Eumeta japonica]|uniref:Uncharacterized protein n=1 Tax=Eumeta variegata TaxID=151549 RepID=A0A4C1ZCV9_EUMVA|nr:hypothetical protein EVAR_47638_1 [Eumeta japonica]